jgi:hypothetical protein
LTAIGDEQPVDDRGLEGVVAKAALTPEQAPRRAYDEPKLGVSGLSAMCGGTSKSLHLPTGRSSRRSRRRARRHLANDLGHEWGAAEVQSPDGGSSDGVANRGRFRTGGTDVQSVQFRYFTAS